MHEGFVELQRGHARAVDGGGPDQPGRGRRRRQRHWRRRVHHGHLSGGGTQVISVGRRCLLGANSGLGVSLGDDCIVEAGLYLTAGTIVTLPGGRRAKARELSGSSGLVFRRNSVTGAVEAVTRPDKQVSLTADLHSGQ